MGISWIITEKTTPQSGITLDVIESYYLYLRKKPKKQNNPKKQDVVEYLADQTIVSYARHLRAVLYFFMERGYTPYFKIKLPKAEEKVKETYSNEEVALLLKKPNLKKCRFSAYRNWVIIMFFVSTATRLNTVTNMKICDLNFDEDTILLRATKGKRQYTIPMDKRLKIILVEYLSYRGGESNDFLFCREDDNQKPLTNSSVKTMIARYNQERGVTKTSAHLMRGFYSKHYLLKGGGLLQLKSILGHKTLTMVLKYVDMYGDDLKVGYDDCNPLATFGKGEPVKMRR